MKCFKGAAQMLMACVLATLDATVAAQQDYPNKPIRFVVPFPPGGSTSAVARLISQKLTESWGQQVIIDNRGGGNTIIGTEAAAKAPADGYTVLFAAVAFVTLPHLLPLPYDTIKDFAAVATLASGEIILVVHPSVPASNLQEFIALAKSRPGQLNYAAAGTGGAIHLASESFNIMTGVKIQHIPYKGSGPAITDLLGGQVQLSFQTPISVIAHVKSGRLRAIAISGASRLATLPQIPTFTEAGLPSYDVRYWNGVVAPAGTPKEVVNRFSAEIARILTLPDTREKLLNQGMEPFYSTPEQTAALIKTDLAKYGRIIKAANIKLEN